MKKTPKTSHFTLAVLASLLVHLGIAWLITFKLAEPAMSEQTASPIMDVILLDDTEASKGKALRNAKITSNKNSHGQSQHAQDNITRAARSPNIDPQYKTMPPKAAMIQRNKMPPTPTSQTKKNSSILNRSHSNSPSLLPPEQAPREEKKVPKLTTPNIPLANLLPTSSALTQLSREFDREKRMKQFLSKEADIGINTSESKYAAYMQSMITSLEAAWDYSEGDDAQLDEFFRNHPQQSELQILIRISVNHHGELIGIKIIRPSPNQQLNNSATAAVHKAAPFKPLPSSWGLNKVNWFITFDASQNTLTYHPERRRF